MRDSEALVCSLCGLASPGASPGQFHERCAEWEGDELGEPRLVARGVFVRPEPPPRPSTAPSNAAPGSHGGSVASDGDPMTWGYAAGIAHAAERVAEKAHGARGLVGDVLRALHAELVAEGDAVRVPLYARAREVARALLVGVRHA